MSDIIRDKRGKIPNFVFERAPQSGKWQIRHQPTGAVQVSPAFGKPSPAAMRTMKNQLKAKLK